jgi:hypothetical protein
MDYLLGVLTSFSLRNPKLKVYYITIPQGIPQPMPMQKAISHLLPAVKVCIQLHHAS